MKFHMQVLIALGLGLKRNWHIFAGLVLGVLVGIWLHKEPSPVIMTTLTFIGQVFIRLIQMVVIPLVISAIVIGITSIGDSKQLGKLGTKNDFLLYNYYCRSSNNLVQHLHYCLNPDWAQHII